MVDLHGLHVDEAKTITNEYVLTVLNAVNQIRFV